MIKVYSMFSMEFKTWNVMSEPTLDSVCLAYGSDSDIDEWFEAHKETHKEVAQ